MYTSRASPPLQRSNGTILEIQNHLDIQNYVEIQKASQNVLTFLFQYPMVKLPSRVGWFGWFGYCFTHTDTAAY
jgi:hypothetical protein